jgi:hypothetical protein
MRNNSNKYRGAISLLSIIQVVFILSSLIAINMIDNKSVIAIAEHDVKASWNITIQLNETYGLFDTITIGQHQNASNGKDTFDLPKPPPMPPSLRGWLQTSLDPPYDVLWEEYKSFSSPNVTWDLSVHWFSMEHNSTFVTISWNESMINNLKYDTITLIENSSFSIDMKNASSYTYKAFSNEKVQFRLTFVSLSTEDNASNGEEDPAGNTTPFLSLVLLIICIIIATYYKKNRKI